MIIENKVCHYCGVIISGSSYVGRFTGWGWHLRTNHYRNWGKV